MTPDRWELVKELFAEASAQPPAARFTFVNDACAGDGALREEVLSLLQAAADNDDSLVEMRAAIASLVLAVDASALPHRAGPHRPDDSLRAALEHALGSQYEIVRLLGQGGMGSVYLARERALERFVAIKVLRPELAEVRHGRERFRREARVAAQLAHPGILPLHTFGEVEGVWYFVMAYVRGVTLGERLRIEGRLPARDALRILAELADALECAHRAGVIHRDIKPENILMDAESGRSMLADFGIAKVQGGDDSLTATGMVVGTPSYMSPEQAEGGSPVDGRSDIYSLGAVGYAMLGGHGPRASSAGSARLRSVAASSWPLRALPSDVPPDLAAVVMRCLAPDPAQRWPSARALRDALALVDEEAAGGLPGSVHELSAFGPYAVLWAAFWLALAASPFRSVSDRAWLALLALIVPSGLVLHLWNAAGGGMSMSQLARVAFWPPDWWGMWWPPGLRRPTDLWRRLPAPARIVRITLSLFILALPARILTREWVEAVSGAGVGWLGRVEVLLIAVAVAMVGGAGIWARRQALSWTEVSRLLVGATATSSGWSSPALRRLLAPTHGGVRAPEHNVPADYRRAIGEIVAHLGDPVRVPAQLAADSASRLVALLTLCDDELGVLSLSSGVNDADRLAAQVAALEGASQVGEEARELATLLRGQLAVVQRMRVRCEMLSSRRSHLMQLLHGTWSHLAMLLACEPDAVPEALHRLDALRSEIEGELAAGGASTAAATGAAASLAPR